jgi:hypothetical protein
MAKTDWNAVSFIDRLTNGNRESLGIVSVCCHAGEVVDLDSVQDALVVAERLLMEQREVINELERLLEKARITAI